MAVREPPLCIGIEEEHLLVDRTSQDVVANPPRTTMEECKLPGHFDAYGEYEHFVAGLVATGLIDDASKLWWDIRPSARFPTLEMRLCGMCPSLDDAIAIVALFQCLVSRLYRLRRDNQRWRIYPRALIQENGWLAQRYGTSAELVDFGKGERIDYADLLDEIIALVAEDAARLDCATEIARARDIAAHGTSAHR